MLQERPALNLRLHGACRIRKHLLGNRGIYIPYREDPFPEGNDIRDGTATEFSGFVALAHINAVFTVDVKVPLDEFVQGFHF